MDVFKKGDVELFHFLVCAPSWLMAVGPYACAIIPQALRVDNVDEMDRRGVDERMDAKGILTRDCRRHGRHAPVWRRCAAREEVFSSRGTSGS